MTEQPLVIARPADGLPFAGLGALVCKMSGASTGDTCSVLELRLEPGGGAPLHVHQHEDELVYVREGSCSVGQANQEWTLEANSWVMFPKNTAHWFRNTTEAPCLLLIIAIPGGLDRYFAAVSGAAQQQPDAIPAINAQYGITFLTE